jgi:hypothetical protein
MGFNSGLKGLNELPRKYIYCWPFFSVALWPNAGHGVLILEVSRSNTMTHHIWYDSPGQVISSPQTPVPDNTQHSQQTNIHAPGGIQTHDLSRRAAADICLRPRGHWDRHIVDHTPIYSLLAQTRLQPGPCVKGEIIGCSWNLTPSIIREVRYV